LAGGTHVVIEARGAVPPPAISRLISERQQQEDGERKDGGQVPEGGEHDHGVGIQSQGIDAARDDDRTVHGVAEDGEQGYGAAVQGEERDHPVGVVEPQKSFLVSGLSHEFRALRNRG
jgi:hypothetical protein